MRTIKILFAILSLIALPCMASAEDGKQSTHKTYQPDSDGWYSRVGSDKIKAETYNDARVINYDWKAVQQIFCNVLSKERMKEFGQDFILVKMYINAIKKKVEKVIFIFNTDIDDHEATRLTDQEMYKIEEELRKMKLDFYVIDKRKVPFFTRYNQSIHPCRLVQAE